VQQNNQVAERPGNEQRSGATAAPANRVAAAPGYELLAAVLDEALEQAQGGKGRDRHGFSGDSFEDQTIVSINEILGSIHGQVYQICKKAIEATRLPPERARLDLLGAINYLAAAVIQIDRQAAAGQRGTP
jgi:hypothetical protein